MEFVSVIVPSYNEETYISGLVESIISQDYPRENMEVLIIDGMSQDNTRHIISEYHLIYPFIRLLDNLDRIVPTALNIGIEKAIGTIIIRMDVHCLYPYNYISSLVKHLNILNADNIGGVCEVEPTNNTIIGKSIALAMSNRFGVGNSLFRVGTKKIKRVDTVPFGCYRKEVFERIGLFDIDMIRNQDDEFNGRLLQNGGKIFLIPEIKISYFARDKIWNMVKMFYQYGFYKPLVNKKLRRPTTFRQFIPLVFVLWLTFGVLAGIVYHMISYIYLGILFLYIFISFVVSFVETIRNKDYRLLFLLPVNFLFIHIGYGLGYLMGIFHFIIFRKDKKNIKITR